MEEESLEETQDPRMPGENQTTPGQLVTHQELNWEVVFVFVDEGLVELEWLKKSKKSSQQRTKLIGGLCQKRSNEGWENQ